MAEFRSGFVAMAGRTNVGKSTLMNRLIGQKVAITCNKPQTTRTRIRTILTEERGQAIFIDTPGIHQAKNKLGKFMVDAAERTLNEVDLILWLVEPVDSVGTGDRHIADILKNNKTPKVLVINKIDTVPAEKVMAMITMYKDLADFDEIVPVSALNGKNEDDLKDVIFKLLPEGPMYYDEDELTDQPERQIAAEIIRESALKNLSDEVPHGIAVGIELMKERKKGGGYINYEENDAPGPNAEQGTGLFDIEATIVCERDSHKGIIIGKGGSMLKKIGTDARIQMEALLGFRVNLKLFVKVKKDWRDSDFLLRNYGFWEEKDSDGE
ncbi:MAG: GTPase Era [Lachnospiraceae bacterium]|nr:GTPase Era [Lachnospiraceae bacterium]